MPYIFFNKIKFFFIVTDKELIFLIFYKDHILSKKIFQLLLLFYVVFFNGCASKSNEFQELEDFKYGTSNKGDNDDDDDDDDDEDDDDTEESDLDVYRKTLLSDSYDDGDSSIKFMKDIAGLLVSRLSETVPVSSSSLPMIVTTPVLADDFAEKNSFSNYLQESLISELNQANFFVVDSNIGDVLEFTKEGNFLLSRDWEKLPEELRVDLALVSTLMLNKRGLNISSRLVNIFTGRVIGSALVYASLPQVSNYFSISRLVTSNDDGNLELDGSGERSVYVIGNKN